MKKWVTLWLPPIIWMVVIFGGSSIGNIPRVGDRTLDAVVHRAAHLIEFAILGALVMRAISANRPVTKREIIITLIIVVLYCASDEFHQRFTPGRSSELASVLFDALGGLIGVGVWKLWYQRIGNESTNKRRVNG